MKHIDMTMISKMFGALACGAALLGAVSCARENTITSNDTEKTYIESWLKVNGYSATPTAMGIYILDDIPGTGAVFSDQDYVYMNYTNRTLNGTISSTSVEKTAQQIGTFSYSTYYGPIVLESDEASMSVGVEDLLTGMRVGGTRTAVIPSWLQVYKRYKKDDEYYKHTNENTPAVYTIVLEDVVEDIDKWEAARLDSYVKKNWGAIDSTGFGRYYKQLVPPKGTAAIPSDTTVYINYIGRLMNGKVFDTTIADTAKFYNIYSSSKTYAPVRINLTSTEEEITMGDDDTKPVTGFQWMLSKMGRYEKGVGAFISKYGYSYSGTGKAIPSYCPLIFEIELVDKPE